MAVNKVIIVGNLGADPDLRYSPSNVACCRLSVAANRRWKDKSGQQHDETQWFPVRVWRERGEACAKFLSKGSLVYVEGELKSYSYEKDGHKMWGWNISAHRVTFLSTGERKSEWMDQPPGFDETPPGPPPSDDDIPF